MRRLRRCAQAEKPAGVARIEPGEREEYEEIGGVELFVPGGLTAHESAEVEVAPDERWRLDGHCARPAARREWTAGEDPPSFRAEVLFAQPAAGGPAGAWPSARLTLAQPMTWRLPEAVR